MSRNPDYGTRAVDVLASARAAIQRGCNAMHAEHSAKGLLQSGATVKAAVRIFRDRTADALHQIFDEIGTQVDHRGRAWSKATAAVSATFEDHMRQAPDVLAASFRLAAPPGPSGHKAAQALIDEVRKDLDTEIRAFRDGWTAPKPKRWNDRHPAIYALLLLIAGSLIGAAITQLSALTASHPSRAGKS